MSISELFNIIILDKQERYTLCKSVSQEKKQTTAFRGIGLTGYVQ